MIEFLIKDFKFSEFKKSNSYRMLLSTIATLFIISLLCSVVIEITKDNELAVKDLFFTVIKGLYFIPIAMLSYYSISNVTTTFNYLKNRDNENFSFSFVNLVVIGSSIIITIQCVRDNVKVDGYIEFIIFITSISIYLWSIGSMYQAEGLPRISMGNFEENERQDDLNNMIDGGSHDIN